ncbi:MAG: hypothetical protein K6G12_02335 [Lachnospiraceae bacterium]|nr:hypothetical protein [Lachnospiraceae bacterium]
MAIDIFNLQDMKLNEIPKACEYCGGELEYSGLGEYTCKNCNKITRDDYGKVRHYIENHPGATGVEVSTMTGVSKATINRFLKEDRIQIKPYSKDN